MALNNLTGQNIQDTYQKVVQTDGTNLADGTGSLLPISFDGNNVIISGSLTANEYIVSSSVTNITVATLSGSTVFGDDQLDTHQFTGSLDVSGSLSVGNAGAQMNIGTIGSAPALGLALTIANYALASTTNQTSINGPGGSSKGIVFLQQNVEKMRLDAAGKLGIGVSLPSYNLDGEGDIRATDDIFCNDDLTVGGDITASGNISASGVITATGGFGTIDGGTF